MVKIKLLLVISICSLCSCEYAYDYTYQVTNNTNAEVKTELKTFEIDSVYTIDIKETKALFVTWHGVEGSKGPYFEDVNRDLDYFVVTKNDTLISKRSYLNNSSWEFNEGLYSTTILNDEFE